MLMATFYPLLDGGVQQMRQVYRGLVALRQKRNHESNEIQQEEQQEQQEKEVKTDAKTPSSESTVG